MCHCHCLNAAYIHSPKHDYLPGYKDASVIAYNIGYTCTNLCPDYSSCCIEKPLSLHIMLANYTHLPAYWTEKPLICIQ